MPVRITCCCIVLLVSTPFCCSQTAASNLPFVTQDLTFPASDGTVLAGRLFAPKTGQARALAVFVWGSGDDDALESNYTKAIAKTFAASGISIFSYNKRGIGRSQGSYSETNFEERAWDTVAALKFARTLPGINERCVGLWGISQAGWVIPKALRHDAAVAFVILVSPGGVSPASQVDFYLQKQWEAAGMTHAEVAKALALHHTLSRYYHNGRGYQPAQLAVDRGRKEGWLGRFRQAAYREDVPASGQIPEPGELQERWAEQPSDYEFVHAKSTYEDSSRDALHLVRPLLVLYGAEDQLVPIHESEATFRKALRKNGNKNAQFHVFLGADHDIQTTGKPNLVEGYRELMRDWILQQCGANSEDVHP